MNSEIDFRWDDLPSICNSNELEFLLCDIFLEKDCRIESCEPCYNSLFSPFDEYGILSELRKSKKDIYYKISKLPYSANIKDIAKVFQCAGLNISELARKAILIYFSGLWQLQIRGESFEKLEWYSLEEIYVQISEDKDYFLDFYGIGLHKSFVIETDLFCYIEPIIFNNRISKIVFDSKNSAIPTHFKKIKFRGVELSPNDSYQFNSDYFDNEVKSFNLNNLTLFTNFVEKCLYSIGAKFENFRMKILDIGDKNGFKADKIYLKNHSCDLKLVGNITAICVDNCDFSKLEIKSCDFLKIPYFDDKSSIKHSVDIDKVTFDNLLKINGDSLEFSRLAEFFNRNNAYMEAQQLHRHYLLAKAKESLKEESKEDNSDKENKPCFCKKEPFQISV